MRKLLLTVCALCTMTGCSTFHAWAPDIIDWVSNDWPLDDKKDEKDTEKPEEKQVYNQIESTAIWYGDVTGDTVGPGILVCSPSLVEKYIGQVGKDYSSSFLHVRFHNIETGQDVIYDYNMMQPINYVHGSSKPYCAAPDDARNWTSNGDAPGSSKWYIYLTGYPEKQAGADGTYRGYAWVPAPGSGEWSTQIKWRTSGNRAATTFVGVVYQREGARYMSLYRWNQRGDGGTYEVPVPGGAITFLE